MKLASKIEEVLEGVKTPESRKKCAIPRELSVSLFVISVCNCNHAIKIQAIVHDCYQKLSEDDDQQQEWDFTVRYNLTYIYF